MTIYIGEIPIYYVSSFDIDRSLKGIEEIHFLGVDAIPYLSEQTPNIRTFGMTGTLLRDSGIISTIDDMAEDILALRERRNHFNYIHDFQARSGWLGIKEASSDKNASSLVTRPYVVSGRFLPKAQYQTRMHSNPAIRPNDFSFSLGVDDCDNYIAIPIGATYLGGDGSTITRTSKDGDITLILATVDNDIKWDINEADRLNGECKIFDFGYENILKNGGFESWSDGTSSVPDGWTDSGLSAIARDTLHKEGAYSAKATGSGTDHLYQSIEDPTRYRGKKLTFGCWAWSAHGAPAMNITIKDSAGQSAGAYHSGGSVWRWLSMSRTIDSSATYVRTIIQPNELGTGITYVDGAILVEASTVPEMPLSTDDMVQVYSRDREFLGDIYIENGLYRVTLHPRSNYISLYYWLGSDYVHLSDFTAGTYNRFIIQEANPDRVRVKLDSGVEVELRRGHPPSIDTGTVDLISATHSPGDQSTSTENYLSLGTNLYICSDESFSIVNATKNLDDGRKWMFYETVSATAEDIAHQAMVDARENRELIQR